MKIDPKNVVTDTHLLSECEGGRGIEHILFTGNGQVLEAKMFLYLAIVDE